MVVAENVEMWGSIQAASISFDICLSIGPVASCFGEPELHNSKVGSNFTEECFMVMVVLAKSHEQNLHNHLVSEPEGEGGGGKSLTYVILSGFY